MTRENEWQGNFDHIHAVYTSFLTRVRRRLVANVGANNPDPIPGLTLNVGADSLDTIEDLKEKLLESMDQLPRIHETFWGSYGLPNRI